MPLTTSAIPAQFPSMKNVTVLPLITAPLGWVICAVNLPANSATFKSLKVIVSPVTFATPLLATSVEM